MQEKEQILFPHIGATNTEIFGSVYQEFIWQMSSS